MKKEGTEDLPADCPICIEPYKGRKIVRVTCQYCPSHACRACVQRYLLQTYEDPHCMECKRGWSSEFMAENFPLTFRKDALRKHRRTILLERERGLLPAMQIYCQYKQEIERLEQQQVEFEKTFGKGYQTDTVSGESLSLSGLYWRMNDTHQDLQRELISSKQLIDTYTYYLEHTMQKVDPEDGQPIAEKLKAERKRRSELKEKWESHKKEFDVVKKKYHEEYEKSMAISRALYEARARYNDQWHGGDGEAAAEATKREFIMKCPDEGCRGFLSSAYKCGTCSKWTCSKCLVVLGAEKEGSEGSATHVCNNDAVETAKTIKKETKPCPKCGTRIFKVDGCDQMWCIMDGCHTAFSWNTGRIVTGVVHNPHYYEWLRRTNGGHAPRDVTDIPCGGLPAAWPFHNLLLRTRSLNYIFRNLTLEIHRRLTELIEYRLRDYPSRPPAGMNKDNDVNYLLKKITEDEWKRQLELNEAKFNRKREIGQILNMVATAGSDIFTKLVAQGNDLVGESFDHELQFVDYLTKNALPELEALRIFTNDSLKALAKREHMAVPQIGSDWEWVPLRALYRTPKSRGPAQKAREDVEKAAGAAAEAADEEINEIVEVQEVEEVVVLDD